MGFTPRTTTHTELFNICVDAPDSILNALLEVDGAGSGLDADLLDGLESSHYYKSAAGTITSGDWNTFKTHGVYKVQHANFDNDTNNPPASYAYGILKVERSEYGGEDRTNQTYIPHGTSDKFIYQRMSNNDTWTAWSKVFRNGSGAGSGLDADKVDGLHASQFLRSDAMTSFNTAGNNLQLVGDTETRTGLQWKQGSTCVWDQQIKATGDLQFVGTTNQAFNVATDGGMNLRSRTDTCPVNLRFSSNSGSDYCQFGTISYTHADSASHGHTEEFTIKGSTDNTGLRLEADVYLASKANSCSHPIIFNGTSGESDTNDNAGDFAIRAIGECLVFYEPEQSGDIHMVIEDGTGVNAKYGFKENGTCLKDKYIRKTVADTFTKLTGSALHVTSDGSNSTAICFDNDGNKNISTNDGSGNFTIKSGVNASSMHYIADNTGATSIVMDSDTVDGCIALGVSNKGLACDLVSYTSALLVTDGINGLKWTQGSDLHAGALATKYTVYHSGNIPTWNQSTTGNAATASKLQTARTISLGGDLSGSTSFDGTSNVTITADVANDSHCHDGRYYTKSTADSCYGKVGGSLDQFKDYVDGDNHWHTNGRDLKVNGKRALVGFSTNDGNLLHINYACDFATGTCIYGTLKTQNVYGSNTYMTTLCSSGDTTIGYYSNNGTTHCGRLYFRTAKCVDSADDICTSGYMFLHSDGSIRANDVLCAPKLCSDTLCSTIKVSSTCAYITNACIPTIQSEVSCSTCSILNGYNLGTCVSDLCACVGTKINSSTAYSAFLQTGADREQTVSGRCFLFNNAAQKMSMDPRTSLPNFDNSSIGAFHIWNKADEASGYNPAGIGLYDGSEYQYLSTVTNNGMLRHQNGNGYLETGITNTGYASINTDRALIKVNKGAEFAGDVSLTNHSVCWRENTDYAAIGFVNTSDSDTNSYMCFKTGDNGNEHFRWYSQNGGTTSLWMQLNGGHLSIPGIMCVGGGLKQDGFTILNGSDTWLRTSGSTGWYNATYGGGMYMVDSTWVRTYGGKGLYTTGTLRADGGVQVDGKYAISADAKTLYEDEVALHDKYVNQWTAISQSGNDVKWYRIAHVSGTQNAQIKLDLQGSYGFGSGATNYGLVVFLELQNNQDSDDNIGIDGFQYGGTVLDFGVVKIDSYTYDIYVKVNTFMGMIISAFKSDNANLVTFTDDYNSTDAPTDFISHATDINTIWSSKNDGYGSQLDAGRFEGKTGQDVLSAYNNAKA